MLHRHFLCDPVLKRFICCLQILHSTFSLASSHPKQNKKLLASLISLIRDACLKFRALLVEVTDSTQYNAILESEFDYYNNSSSYCVLYVFIVLFYLHLGDQLPIQKLLHYLAIL